MRVVVLGATGTAGRSTVPVLVAAGHEVLAHSRSDDGAARLSRAGATPLRGDADDPGTLRSWLTGADAAIDLRVSVPAATRAMAPWAWREYTRLRARAAAVLVDAALAADVPRVVHDTATMVYADGRSTPLDETSPVDARGALAANLATETHVARLTAHGGAGVVLRFAPFYGPDDEFSRALMRAARRGRVPILGHVDGWTSAVHTDDVGTALLVALTAPGGVYNVADDEPLTRRVLLGILADAAGVPRVRPLPGGLRHLAPAPLRSLARSHRVDASRFRELGWQPRVRSRRTGWPLSFAADAVAASASEPARV
ncbi:NAD(P)-dependent oxidoreductase [Georgenia sp. H159]|uniref:NAD-dependent epimerase/dehydratase family protein n=1 Tax=Georgenia sp. H159 TaxID=3076115 RepID=UPI002D7A09FD|nr:NAD(P)-dependent oxidoreductase [Georgenia sp. H159]